MARLPRFGRTGRVLLTALLLTATPWGGPAAAQIISPGKLSRAHAGLEGMRQCVSCHRLRQAGIAAELCLDCHEELAARLRQDRGYHAGVERECGNCHKEHLGPDARMVRYDTLAFRHGEETGYALEGAHASATCGDCHRPELIADSTVLEFRTTPESRSRTRLGLPDACVGCHRPDNPHGPGYASGTCDDCHASDTWKEAPRFDHDRTDFPLVGGHAQADCASCHREGEKGASGAGLRFDATAAGDCGSCHADDDAHAGQFRARSCGDCHEPARWKGASRFDHGRAAFHLTGAHRRAECTACHEESARRGARAVLRYRPVEHGDCSSCHEDAHEGAMSGRCSTCHGTSAWSEVNRSRVERNFDHAATGFALAGAHAAAECAACHDTGPRPPDRYLALVFGDGAAEHAFPPPEADWCRSCHLDRHDGAFTDGPDQGDCAACHRESGWVPTTFGPDRHAGVKAFPLEGAHLAVACVDCHEPADDGLPAFRLEASTCASCHGDTTPHGDQFDGRDCSECHDSASFRETTFDHASARFVLDGAHADLACAECHSREADASGNTLIRYTPLGFRCRDCHGGAA